MLDTVRKTLARKSGNVTFANATGQFFVGDAKELLKGSLGRSLKGKVQLIFTSPPFPLNRKKRYGNLTGEEYKEWFLSLGPIFSDLLKEDGSIIIEMGNAWEDGRPVQSLLHLECLLNFVRSEDTAFRLCQQFICYNPSRLPSPAQWVTKERIRLTDSFTHLWWIAKKDRPKADNRKVLRRYSKSMESLLDRKEYNDGIRPSQHNVSKSGFLKDNGGSIAHNFFELDQLQAEREVRLPNVFSHSNTVSNDAFLRRCRDNGIAPHPARMAPGLASFFIELLTDEGDLVLDPFAGSNSTGSEAAQLDRRWLAIDTDSGYAKQASMRVYDCPEGSASKEDANERKPHG